MNNDHTRTHNYTAELADIVELLEQRADLLQPRHDLMESAFERCERHKSTQSKLKLQAIENDHVWSPDDSHDQAVGAAGLIAEGTLEGATQEALPSPSLSSQQIAQQTIQESRHEEQMKEEHRAVAGRLKGKKRKGRYLKAGTEVQGYRIMGMLGKGGMGEVYRALQLSMNREVAFKVLSSRYAKSKSFRKRFLREAHSAGRLHHRHLIAVHDVDETTDGILFFSMELVEGKSIADIIDDNGRMDEVEALRLCRQILEALAYAHEAGIIHRDIKPDNIILDLEGAAKVADLGLSRIDDDNQEDAHVTAENVMMGTPYYMSPEQSRDAHNVDHRTDIYSLGATLYHMVCGQVPFDGDSPLDVVVAASTEKLEYPDPAPSIGIRRLIEKLMAKDPEKRPQNGVEAIALLDRLQFDPKGHLGSPNATNVLISTAIIILIILVITILAVNSGDGDVDTDIQDSSLERPEVEKIGQASSLNILEHFYFDSGTEPTTIGEDLQFNGDGYITHRLEGLLNDDQKARLILQFKDLSFTGSGREFFKIQFIPTSSVKLNRSNRSNRGNRGVKNISPALVVSPRGVYFMNPQKVNAGTIASANERMAGRGKDQSRHIEKRATKIGELKASLGVIITAENGKITLSLMDADVDMGLSPDPGNQIVSFDIRQIEKINVQWMLQEPILANLHKD